MSTATTIALQGKYPLTTGEVDRRVTRTSPGVYVLSHDGEHARYVGRSDKNVRSRLKDWVGTYAYFWFAYASSPKDAFEKECTLFHKFGGSTALDNKIHPDRPANCNWQCPVCSHYG